MKRIGKAALVAVIVILAILLLAWAGVTVVYWEYFSTSQRQFLIPGLSDRVIPQGFFYLEQEDCFLMSGYMAKSGPSRVYVIQPDGSNYYVNLMNEDGTPYTRHSGGVCANGEFVYIAGKSGVEVFLLADVLAGRDAVRQGTVEMGFRISFCDFADGYLLAGTYYRPESHETPREHHFTTPAGDRNHAIIAIFPQSDTAPFGVEPLPVAALSIDEEVQGVAVLEDGTVVTSASNFLKVSRLKFHTVPRESFAAVPVLGQEVPLYGLDSASCQRLLKVPPMSEEMAVKDGKLYVLLESASAKFVFGNFIRSAFVRAVTP